MRKYIKIAALVAAGTLASNAIASSVYTETYSGSPFAGFQEQGPPSGFGTRYDQAGRTLATAAVTTNLIDPGNLSQIVNGLYLNTDADLFKIQIVNPASFTAYITGTTQVLSLFDASGTAVAASRGGGVANQLDGTALSLSAGFYYIAVSQTDTRTTAQGAPYPTPYTPPTIGVARNAAGDALFDFSTNGVKTPVVGLSDYVLSSDLLQSFTVYGNATYPLTSASFTAGSSSTINLTGADFAVTPEPGTMSALLAIGAVALRRRNRR